MDDKTMESINPDRDQHIEVRKVKEIIKSIMKKQGLQYKDLANALDISVPTVHRILGKDNLSLERLQEILDWLGINLLDVAEIATRMRGQVVEHTFEQEEYLANHPQHLLIFEYIRDGGYSARQIKEKYFLDQQSLNKYLRDLELQNLIELYPNGKVKPLINHIRWRRGGQLRKKFGPKMAKFFYDVTLKAIRKEDDEELKYTHHRGSLGIMMRPETFEKMRADIDEIEKKYRTLSKMEVPLEPKENLTWVIYSFLASRKDLKDSLYEIPERVEGKGPEPQATA